MDRRNEVPWFMDLSRHGVKLGVGLGLSVPVSGVMLRAYGVDVWSLLAAVGTVSACVGMVYFIDAMGRRYG